MAKFNDMVVTESGKIQYTKAISGKTIEFTKAIVGSGRPASQEAAKQLTAPVNPKLAGALNIDTASEEGKALIAVSISNASITESVSITEIGLFCKDPDTGEEVMYAFAYSPTDSDVIPPITNGELTWVVNLVVYIENATGSNSSQGSQAFTPVVKTVATSGTETDISSSLTLWAKVASEGIVKTVFYKITGTLDAATLANTLSKLTISLPYASSIECAVSGRMTVVTSDGDSVLVDLSGVISAGGQTIDFDYIGKQSGTVTILITAHYLT